MIAVAIAARVVSTALAFSLLLAVSWPHVVDGVVVETTAQAPSSPTPTVSELLTQPLVDGLERVVADSAGHRFDRGRVREVAVGPDGSVYVAVGRRVVELGVPGGVDARTRGWRSFPRRISVDPEGRLWAMEAGGAIVVRDGGRWHESSAEEVPLERPQALLQTLIADPPLRTAGDDAARLLAAAPSLAGEVWVVADTSPDPHTRPARHALLREVADGWEVLGPSAGMPQDRGPVWTTTAPRSPAAIVVDHDGRVWFSIQGVGLYVFDGSAFQRIHAQGLRSGALDLEVDPDGTVWIASTTGGLYRWVPGGSTA